ncbi:cysteine dioxygenase family protein [Streptomyces pristinaespiralis]|jgi:predicted metal-dependent enzyme (double-stranded beta helix superfamily)|uniref:cysteine dioxygenase family protein n=1 Tax=Streptomyces pristinaespiralis TaxID=38300 RepID=UPI00383731DA
MTPAPTAQSASSAPRTTDRLDALVAGVREVVGRGLPPDPTAYLVGERLAPHLGAPDLLTAEQRQSDPDRYRQHLLHAEHDGSFSVVALVWLPGQGTSVHDHVSWCTTGVHEGREQERRYRLVPAARADGAARLVATADVVSEQGEFCGFAPPGDIHRVWNPGPSTAVSLHVYGADISRLGSSVRRVYALPADR